MKREASGGPPATPQAVEENIDAVKVWEQAALDQRSTAVRFSEWVTRVLGGGPSLALHAAWFGFWVIANSRMIPGIEPFDRFPFPLLTTMVSLEAIFLSTFILISQNYDMRVSERRAQLDLQINLLSEQENTKMLQILERIAKKVGAHVGDDPQVRALEEATRPEALVQQIDEAFREERDRPPKSGKPEGA